MSPKLRARRPSPLLTLCLGVLAWIGASVGGCSVPSFEFEEPMASGGSAGAGAAGGAGVPHCRNGELDAELGESDLDCGRGCSGCNAGRHCTDAADCAQALLCHEGTCVDAGCTNDVADGLETDVDCGGAGCPPCIAGQRCAAASDCETGVCREGKCQAAACDDGVENGKEASRDCGGNCPPCLQDESCRVGEDCVSGECHDRRCGAECGDGFANCDKNNDNGCEIALRSDPENCGECGSVCKLPHASAECSAGECRIAVDGCEAGYEDCNGDPTDGCEVKLKSDELNCGACDRVCPDLNGEPRCAAGKCQITCDEGFEDCDDSRDNGCEVNIEVHSQHCGGCDEQCPEEPGHPAYCKNAECGQTACPEGRGDCNGDPDDEGGACETSLDDDVDNCGACGNRCRAVNADVACVAGKCVIESCKGSFADCNGAYRDGCETNVDVSTEHCGACDERCRVANGSPKCDAGSCTIKSCSGTFRDCDGLAKNGCEIDLATSDGNCGACGNDCDGKYPHASSACVASSCGPPMCDPGYGDCSGGITDGCETNVRRDNAHCGGCGKACQTVGVNVTRNTCEDGECRAECAGNYLTCDNDTHNGCEADSTSDSNNCGACGTVCSKVESAHVSNNQCIASSCSPTCQGTYRDCDDDGSNGCEIDTAVTRTSCGACGNVCDQSAAANVVQNPCRGSACRPQCVVLYDDCDGKPENGCEKSVASDVANCGACGTVCQTQNASATSCVRGACLPVCRPGWGSCASPELGCVTPLGTATDCLSCGDVCPASKAFCEPTGCADHRDIVVVNSGETAPGANDGSHATAGWNPSGNGGAQITLKHALATPRAVNGTATNRMLVAGVASTDNYTKLSTIKVTYGGVNMPVAVEQLDANKQSYAGIFYLLDAALPASSGTHDVIVRFGGPGTWGHGGINVVELRNVAQKPPFKSSSASSTTACATNPSRAVSLAFDEPGSFVYALLAARGGRSAALTSAPGLIESWNQRQATPDNLMAAAAYTIADDDRSISWTVANCYNSATTSIAVERLNSD